MRYLPEAEFVTASRGPFRMTNAKGGGEDRERASVSDLLHWLLGNYTPQLAKALTLQQLRLLNRCIDVLEGEPQRDGHYCFEEAEYEVLQQVALDMAVLLTPRNAPLLEDLLKDAPKQLHLRAVGGDG